MTVPAPRRPLLLPLRWFAAAALAGMLAAPLRAGDREAEIALRLLADPSLADWRALSRFDGTLTRREFDERLRRVFDPQGGIGPYLRVTDREVEAFADRGPRGALLAVIRLAPPGRSPVPPPDRFRSPAQFAREPRRAGAPPLAGLRVALEPADIGGAWAKLEDRSVDFPGYGTIREGNLNLIVAFRLRDRLESLGARVFLVRTRDEPVTSVRPRDLTAIARDVLRYHPEMLPEAYRLRVKSGAADLRWAADLLFTKSVETRARAAYLRRSFQPDLTIVIQHNATADSASGKLNPINRNTFFVEGAYSARELAEPEQRFRLLTKLFQDVTPIETDVAADIAEAFRRATGYPPVLYGDSASTWLPVPGDHYVVARNLAFNREHDGPVVVTEPYFMNQRVTLLRLLAGDYAGRRVIAGRPRISIYREYADAVAQGILDAYRPRR
jgi:hypothetical protein